MGETGCELTEPSTAEPDGKLEDEAMLLSDRRWGG
jgi:hypothetical protein